MTLCLIHSNFNKECGLNQCYNDISQYTSPMMLTTPRLNINNLPYGTISINNINYRQGTQVVYTTRSPSRC